MRRVIAIACSLAAFVPAQPAPPQPGFDSVVQPFLARNCVMCHNAKMRSGELDLQHHATPANALKDRHVWENVVQRIRTGEMPPKGLPRLKQADVARVTGFIEGEYDRRDEAAGPDPGRVTARRLNRYEYNNTVRDLLAVDFRPADDFPADDSGYGFDNIADVLSLSPVLMEKYMAAAEKIATRAIVADVPTYRATRTQMKAEAAGMGEHLKAAPLAPGAIGPMPSKTALHVRYKAPVEAEYEIRVGLGGSRPGSVEPVTVHFWIDGQVHSTFEVDPRPDKKRSFEHKVRLTAGEHRLSAALFEAERPPEPPMRNGARPLLIDLFELRGPYNPVAPPLPESHRRIVRCGHPLNRHEITCDREILTPLARRVLRRPPSEKEIAGLLRLADRARADGETFEGAMRVALQALLVSPHFLFRIEREPNEANPRRVSEFELASRLSYFLWASTPDDELLELAERTQLRASLDGQIHRMLQDPKARSLSENFAGQWLQLRNLDEAKPDPDRFPEFDDELRTAMKRETELFFDAVVRDDRSVLDFIDAPYTYLNDRLAEHYGLPGVEGSHFRRVALRGPQRSGVLTHASVLTVSSYPTRTSPVIRGKWVLENLLNAPPPPPPENVPNLDEEAVGSKGSLRQQLELHRSNPVCASCHSKMDPLGFGLENYDATGKWRTREGRFPIDPTGTLPSGKSFRGPAELKVILRTQKSEFAKCLTEKLLTYALGRGLEPFDRPAVQGIQQRLAAKGYRFSELAAGIIESMPFQMRRAEASNRSALRPGL